MPNGRLIGFRQKLAKGVVEMANYFKSNMLGGLEQQFYIIQPLFSQIQSFPHNLAKNIFEKKYQRKNMTFRRYPVAIIKCNLVML